jgi:hypothetical protein
VSNSSTTLFFFYLYLDNADTNNYKRRESGRGSLGQKHLALFNSSLFFLLEYSGSVYKCSFCTQLQHANAAHTFSSFPSRMTSAYTLAQGYTNCGPRDIFGLLNYELSNLPFFLGARGDVVVKALRYKPEGQGFDSRWCH